MSLHGLGEDDAFGAGSVQSAEVHAVKTRNVDEDQVLGHIQDRVESVKAKRDLQFKRGTKYHPLGNRQQHSIQCQLSPTNPHIPYSPRGVFQIKIKHCQYTPLINAPL